MADTKTETATGLLERYMQKNADCPHIMTSTHINKLVPVKARTSEIKEEMLRVFDSGNREHLEKLIEMTICNPNAVIMGGNVFNFGPVTKITSIDSKLESRVTDRIRDREAQGEVTNYQELFLEVMGRLWMTDRMGDINKISQKDYARERIQFSIEPKDMLTRGTTVRTFGVFATKYIPSFRIRYVSEMAPNSPDHNGAWQISDCVLAVEIIGRKNSYGQYEKITFEPKVYVLYPKPFIHPFVDDRGGICTGLFGRSPTLKKLLDMPFIDGVFKYMNQLDHLFKTGYSEQHMPRRANLHNIPFTDPDIHVFTTFKAEEEDWVNRARAQIRAIHEQARIISRKADAQWKW